MTRVFLEVETTLVDGLNFEQSTSLVDEIARRDLTCMRDKGLYIHGKGGGGPWSVVLLDLGLQRAFVNGGFKNNPTAFEWDEESKSWGYIKRL